MLILRFGFVGILNTVVGYVTFAVLISLGLNSTPALILAMVISILFNFQTSRKLVFRSSGRVSWFVGIYCGLLFTNWALLNGLIAIGVRVLVAQAILVLPLAAVSFFAQRALVFSDGQSPQ
jgi:putative flippase GtrA